MKTVVITGGSDGLGRASIMDTIYQPIQPGIPNLLASEILYKEATPPRECADLVHCFWTLSAYRELKEDFEYLVLPDGCVDIIFDIADQPDFTGARIMTPNLTVVKLNLGRLFSYVGIRLRPGVWMASVEDIIGGSLQLDRLAGNDFRQFRERLAVLPAIEWTTVLTQLIAGLEQQGVIGKGLFTHLLANHLAATVENLIPVAGYSRRQLQRRFRESTGYRPHDFIKIMRFQQALSQCRLDMYADQSHFIRECKRITGMTPRAFRTTYF